MLIEYSLTFSCCFEANANRGDRLYEETDASSAQASPESLGDAALRGENPDDLAPEERG